MEILLVLVSRKKKILLSTFTFTLTYNNKTLKIKNKKMGKFRTKGNNTVTILGIYIIFIPM